MSKKVNQTEETSAQKNNKAKTYSTPAKNTKTFTDGERATTWGLYQTSIEQLEKEGVPYVFNPENKKAVVLFDGRHRISSVINIFKCRSLPTILRSKKVIEYFLEIEKDAVMSLQFGFGLDLKRLMGEFSASVEIAHIIGEFKFISFKLLNDYILKERPELYKELVTHHSFYQKCMTDFESIDRLKEINDTLREGFYLISNSQNDKELDNEERYYGTPW